MPRARCPVQPWDSGDVLGQLALSLDDRAGGGQRPKLATDDPAPGTSG